MAEPTVTNLNNIISQIAGLLGVDTSDPSGAMFGQLITNWLKQNVIQPATGLSPTDPLWTATLYTNMTDFGVMMQGMNSQANSIGLRNMMQLQASARYELLEGWQRTATSLEEFNRMSVAERGGFEDYNAFIQHKTQGMMDNPILSTALQMWDPTGKLMASAYTRQASANIAREAMWRGDRNYQEQADAVANIFLNPDGSKQLDYDKRDYGQMTMNESAAVLAAITRNKGLADFAPGETNMEEATKAMRTRLQELTKAMSPLKDFFGDDVPNMIRFLEELAGKSLGELGTGVVSDLTRRVTNSLATGLYTADQMSAVTKSLNQTLGQMNTGFYMEPASITVADTMLSTVNAGITPALMNNNSFREAVSERLLRHAASPFANSINLTYSAWRADREQSGEKDTSMETFRKMYQDLRTGNEAENRPALTAEAAMLQLSGAATVNQMYDIGYRNLGYTEAAQAGLGASMANAEGAHERISRFIAGLGSEEDQKAVRNIYSYLVTNREEGLTMEGAIKNIESWGPDNKEATDEQRRMYEMWNTMNQNASLKPLMTDVRIMGNQVDVTQKTTNADRMRRRTEFVNDIFQQETASDPMELLRELVLTKKDRNEGILDKFDNIRDKANMTELVNTMGVTEQDIKNIDLIRKAQGSDTEKQNEATMKYLLDIGPNGKNRTDLNPYLRDYEKNPEDEKAKDALNFALKLTPDVLKAFSQADEAENPKEKGKALADFVAELKSDKNAPKRTEGESDDAYQRRRSTWEAQQTLKKAAGLTYQYGDEYKKRVTEEGSVLLNRFMGAGDAKEHLAKFEDIMRRGGDSDELENWYKGIGETLGEGGAGLADIKTHFGRIARDVKEASPATAESAANIDTNQLLTRLLGDGQILDQLKTAIEGLTSWLTTNATNKQVPAPGAGDGGGSQPNRG